MIGAQHHDYLAGALASALGRASESIDSLRVAGFDVHAQALEAEADACEAAVDGRWGDCYVATLVASAVEPAIYLPVWQALSHALLVVLGAAAANSDTAAIVPHPLPSRRWGSAHGVAEELPTGALRVQVPLSLGRNLAVVLPPMAGGCHE